MSAAGRLGALLGRALEDAGVFALEAPLVVALSGGRDSVVLLHLLRFSGILSPARLVAAHLDHGMRPGSAADRAWVRGLCRAWGVPLHARRPSVPPGDEAEARRARYGFLEEVRREVGAAVVLTAHHAEDQAETVLFRAVRGSGLRGLRGILPYRAPGVLRPLLEATGEEMDAYARAAGLGWRTDPTNRLPWPRNVLRHEVLPRIEEVVAPGARAALAGLARRARDDEAAWESLLPELLEPLDLRVEADGLSFLRAPLLRRPPPLRARLLRALASRAGTPLSDAGTRSAVTFSTSGASGAGLDLTGGVRLQRELGRLAFRRAEAREPDRPLTIPSEGEGEGEVILDGRRWRVSWGPGPIGGIRTTFRTGALRFPLEVRGWSDGDRIRFPYGSKKLKKVFLEARVPAPRRRGRPVVVDADQEVLWIPGIARSTLARGAEPDALLHMGITDADND